MKNYLRIDGEKETVQLENAAPASDTTKEIRNIIARLIGAVGLASAIGGCQMPAAAPGSSGREAREAIFSEETPACWHENRLGERIPGQWRLCRTTLSRRDYEMMETSRDVMMISRTGDTDSGFDYIEECGELPASYDFPGKKTFLEARCLVNDTLDNVIYEGRECKGKIEIKSSNHFGSLSFVPMRSDSVETPFVPYVEPFGQIGKTTTTIRFGEGRQECRVSIVAENNLTVRVVE